jgi:hypothetical protein
MRSSLIFFAEQICSYWPKYKEIQWIIVICLQSIIAPGIENPNCQFSVLQWKEHNLYLFQKISSNPRGLL